MNIVHKSKRKAYIQESWCLLMGVQERREREKKEQRQRILNAALHIITKEGFAALSMRRLAEQIEYSPASIYLHFESREQIARELCEAGFVDLLERLSDATALPGTTEALHTLSSAYVDYGLKNPEMYRLIFMGDSEYMNIAFSNQTEDNAGTRAYKLLVDLAARLQKDGFMQDASTVEFAELIWMTLHGIVSLHITCVGRQLASPQRLVQLATEMFIKTKLRQPNELSVPVSTRNPRRASKKVSARTAVRL